MNECLTNPCHDQATCNNNEGSYLCTCQKGFTGDGRNCDDIKSCLENPCHENATCNDVAGSFVCTCTENFKGDGFSCQGK